MLGNLYIIGTPIGNLEDITLRAIRILSEVDFVLAEDTRVTKRLLDKYEIDTPLKRFDAKVENEESEKIIELLENGKSFALVGDAGTPSVSDPGAILVNKVREKSLEIKIIPIPGPSAITTILSVSGIKGTEFTFLGFVPHKKGKQTFIEKLVESKNTVILYESVHRITKTLDLLSEKLARPEDKKRKIIIGRELTKIFEEIVSGGVEEVSKYFKENPEKVKGEFVVVVEGKE